MFYSSGCREPLAGAGWTPTKATEFLDGSGKAVAVNL